MRIDKMEIKNEINRGLVWALLEKGKQLDQEYAGGCSTENGYDFRRGASIVSETEEWFDIDRARNIFGGSSAEFKFTEMYFGIAPSSVASPDPADTTDHAKCNPDSGPGIIQDTTKLDSLKKDDNATSASSGTSIAEPEVPGIGHPGNAELYRFLVAVARKRQAGVRDQSTKDWSSVSYFKAARSVHNSTMHIWNLQLAMGLKDIGPAIGADIKRNFFMPMSVQNRKHRLPTEDLEDESPEYKK